MNHELGTKENPYTLAPKDWKESGIPYGAWCRCFECGLVHRITISFDCYANGPGEPLTCENCKMNCTVMTDAQREAFERIVFEGESNGND